jgi:hypothetical protein
MWRRQLSLFKLAPRLPFYLRHTLLAHAYYLFIYMKLWKVTDTHANLFIRRAEVIISSWVFPPLGHHRQITRHARY